jgi:outer membrane protein
MFSKTILKYLAVASLVLNLQANEVYTVDELILKSLENSPELKISNLNYKAAQQQYKAAFSNYLPKVDLHASVSKAGMSDISSAKNSMLDDNTLLGNLSLKQIIYDFGKTGSNADFAQYESDSKMLNNIQKISDKKREIKEAYYNLLKAKALIDVQIENVKLNKAQLYRSEKYFKAGIRTKIDVSDAQVALIKSKIELKNAQYELKLKYADLDRAVGFTSLEDDYTVYSQELDLDSLYQSIQDYDLDLKHSIEFAYEHKPQIKEYNAKIKSSHSLVDVSSSQYYPQLYLGANYTKQSLDKFKSFIPQDQWQVGVNLDWNLYQGGSSKAAIAQSKINATISEYALRDLQLQIKQEVTTQYINVYRSKDTLALAQSLMEVSAQKFHQAGKRYEHGLSDYIELQQSRQEYIDSKASLIIDYYDYYIAIANLDNAIGR